MEEVRCRNCGRYNNPRSKFCAFCGSHLPSETSYITNDGNGSAKESDMSYRDSQYESNGAVGTVKKKRLSKKGKIVLIVVGVLFAIGLLNVIMSIFFYDGTPSESSFDSYAIVAAKSIIKDALKDPFSAKFNSTEVAAKDANHKYIILVDVYAKNGFGAYTRNKFYVYCKVDSDCESYYYNKYLPYLDATEYTLSSAISMYGLES